MREQLARWHTVGLFTHPNYHHSLPHFGPSSNKPRLVAMQFWGEIIVNSTSSCHCTTHMFLLMQKSRSWTMPIGKLFDEQLALYDGHMLVLDKPARVRFVKLNQNNNRYWDGNAFSWLGSVWIPSFAPWVQNRLQAFLCILVPISICFYS